MQKSTIISTLRQVGPLTIALTLALMGNFAYSAWSNPTAAPTGGNVPAPINTGPSTQTKEGRFNSGLTIQAGNNILATNNIAAINGFVRASTSVRSNQYCDYAGNNCFTPTSVGGSIDTSTFLNTSGTAQSKSGDLTARDLTATRDIYTTGFLRASTSITAGTWISAGNDIAAGGRVRAGTEVRSPEYCDAAGANCFEATDIVPVDTSTFLNTGSTTQSKSGRLIVSSLGSGGHLTAGTWISAGNNISAGGRVGAGTEVRSPRYCDAAGNNCFESQDIIPEFEMNVVRIRDTGTFAGIAANTQRTITISCPANHVFYNGEPSLNKPNNCIKNSVFCGGDGCIYSETDECASTIDIANNLQSATISVRSDVVSRNFTLVYYCLGEVKSSNVTLATGRYYYSGKEAVDRVCTSQGVSGRCDRLFNNSQTRLQACQILRPGSTVAEFGNSGFNSPGNNTVVRYNGSTWEVLPARSNNSRVDWIVCII